MYIRMLSQFKGNVHHAVYRDTSSSKNEGKGIGP